MMKDYLGETNPSQLIFIEWDSVWMGIKYIKQRPESYTSFIETLSIKR